MKKSTFLNLVLLASLLLYSPLMVCAQTVIRMEKKSGVYYVPCTVNGIKLKFIFDTGAGDVCISLSEAAFMLKNGYIKPEDILGEEKRRIADGTTVKGSKLIIRELKIGDLTLNNVEASIIHTSSAPLLLGQSALERFGSYMIDNKKQQLVLGSGNNSVGQTVAKNEESKVGAIPLEKQKVTKNEEPKVPAIPLEKQKVTKNEEPKVPAIPFKNLRYFQLTSSLEYYFVEDSPGEKKARPGSIVSMHIRTIVNDSALFDSYKMNNNEPVPAQIQKPSFNGDLMEGLAMMSAGDSAIFRSPADSVFRGGQFPPFVKSGDKVNFFVKMVSVKTENEYNQEKEEAEAKQNIIDKKLIEDYINDNGIQAELTESGLYYVITQKGSGDNAKAGQDVTMNYTGRLLDGTVFDSNVDPKFGHVQPFNFKLGAGQVIKGWDEGVALLNKGAKATLLIPSSMAYGSRAMPGGPNNPKGIPANSVLLFDVEMVEAK